MKATRMTRRQVLRSGALGALGLGFGPRFFLRSASAETPRRILVALFQRGAVDALSMFVPYEEPDYHALRSSIAIPPPGGGEGAALDLDGQFGLHPAMASLLPAFDAGELAVVHACGSHHETRSHFDAQDFMETALPGDKTATDGWLNRHLQVTEADDGALRAVALSSSVPRALSGPESVHAGTSLVDLSLGAGREGDVARRALERMYAERDDLLGVTVRDTLSRFDVFRELDRAGYRPANGARYPQSELGRQLREVAQVLKAGIGVEIAFLESGGWDTHANQSGVLSEMLRDLADGLAAFRVDLGDALEDVCVLTMSEFGRTLAENGTRGTDHGHGTAMMVLGGTVRGGRVHGQWPGLSAAARYQGRDLAVTTDFRTLFAELVERHLGNPDVGSVFPGFQDDPGSRLGVIA